MRERERERKKGVLVRRRAHGGGVRENRGLVDYTGEGERVRDGPGIPRAQWVGCFWGGGARARRSWFEWEKEKRREAG
jgi:hypothetical protein